MKKITILICSFTIFISSALLLFYIYFFIEQIFNKGLLRIIGFQSDIIFSNWIFNGILIYSSFLIIKKNVKGYYFYQFALIGLIIEFITYKFIFNINFYFSILLIIYISLLIFFNLQPVIKVNNWLKISKYKYFKAILINISIIVASLLYYFIKYRYTL